PMSLQRDDQATGRLRLVAMALRGLTLLACVGRRQRAAEGAKRAGREAGNPRRETARPTAERLLEAFEGLTLTVVVKGCQQTDRHITTLSPLQQRLLEILGFSLALYTRLCTVSSEPPEKWANRKKWMDEITNYFLDRQTSGFVAGFNNKIKVDRKSTRLNSS